MLVESLFISQTEGYDRLSYLPVNVCICIPLRTLFAQTWYVISAIHYTTANRARTEGVIIVILCDLYYNVLSAVNETWGNLTSLHLTLHQRCISLCRWLASGLPVAFMCFGGGVALERDYAGRVGSYDIKSSLLLLASLKLPTLHLTIYTYIYIYKSMPCIYVKS